MRFHTWVWSAFTRGGVWSFANGSWRNSLYRTTGASSPAALSASTAACTWTGSCCCANISHSFGRNRRVLRIHKLQAPGLLHLGVVVVPFPRLLHVVIRHALLGVGLIVWRVSIPGLLRSPGLLGACPFRPDSPPPETWSSSTVGETEACSLLIRWLEWGEAGGETTSQATRAAQVPNLYAAV